MKKIFTICGLLLATLLAVTSCDMERFPKNSIATEQSLLSAKDAQQWSNGLYNKFRGRQYGIFVTVPDRQADQLNATISYGNRGGNPHGWKDFKASDYDIRDTWSSYYFALKEPNYLIEHLPELKDNLEKDEDKAYVDVVMGEAHFVRAYYYAELVKRFGHRYKASSADSDLGVPLVLKFDVTEKPARATNKATYDQIFADIAAAKSLLASVPNEPMSKRFNADAATALEARARLEMKDYKGALAAANKLISSGKYPLVAPEAASFVDMWRNDKSSEDILQLFISRPDEMPSGVGPYVSASASDGAQSPDWIPSQWMIDLYDQNDLRKPIYFDVCNLIKLGEVTYEKELVYIKKFWGNEAYSTTEDTKGFFGGGMMPSGVIAPKVFRIAEMYLIAAEAAYQTGGDATKYLNPLRVSRGLDPLVGVSGDALFQEIKDERTRELAFEGFRLWDLRRWNMPMVRRSPQTVNGQYADFLSPGTNNFPTLRKEANDSKWIWGIPQNDVKVNPNIVQNPGWADE